ncbi:GNAT family N-acetyltransferase [Streptomyces sp. NPDC002758]
MDAVRLRRVNRWQAQGLSGKLTDLYVDSRETPPPEAYRRPNRRHFLNRLTADIRRPGFAMVIAETNGLVGCAFGFPVRSDGFWWLGFDGALPRGIEQLTASSGVFAITDILVRPHPQDQGVGRRLQERLLADGQASLGATLVDRADHPTLTALRSGRWLDVGEIWKPISATLLRVLVLPLGERTAARLEGLAHDARTRWPG